MTLVFATNNEHKINEIRPLLPADISLITLKEAGIDIDIPEPHDSLQDNAKEKANTVYVMTGKNCFSEDTGLEVEALNNEPGVRSSRYAGENNSSQKNMDKLLTNLKGIQNRKARFRTVICLILDGREFFFEGICEGVILEDRRGKEGFGYDPIFQPQGAMKSFAEMKLEEKSRYSHRKKATDGLVAFLNSLQVNKEY